MTTQDDAPSLYDANFFEEWEIFADQLKLIFQYGGPEAVTRPIATKQTQYVLASMAIARLLSNIGQRDTGAHFHRLAEALQDVVEGINHPLFKVEKIDRGAAGKRGRQNDTSETWRIRASLCIGVQFLMAGGVEQKDAVAFVIRKHRMQFVNLTRPGTNLKSSLPTWLKTFATDATSNEVALSTYKEGITGLAEYQRQYSPNDIRRVGEQLIAGAAKKAEGLVRTGN